METSVETATNPSVAILHKDDVEAAIGAQAPTVGSEPKMPEDEVPMKKRKTRRGKSKRRNVHPYKTDNKTKLIKPEAPYNSNRFLIEDHGNIEELDERLKNVDQVSDSTVTRTRDSSFSVDSDNEFYSTPDDEEEFLIKDFHDQYESLQAERFQNMSKNELIQEYLQMEAKVEVLTKRLQLKSNSENENGVDEEALDCKEELKTLKMENDALKRENESLKNKISRSSSLDSEDSETDSSDSCSSSTSTSSMSTPESPTPNYAHTNGHSALVENP